ncbi:ROK family protein [Canibacter zhoujuaniae]|uniref:ROK family protein n=1 Tax=Canibacter zhoujuaniae TaxID=2708343 RepID=UPI00142465C1|nr:ROK family protein [Canibacter zhoujuaniae]
MSILAFDIGGTKIRAGLVDGDQVVDPRVVPTEAHLGGRQIMAKLQQIANSYTAYEGIAVAAAGVIKDGVVVSSSALLPGWQGTNITGELADAAGCAVAALGDVHAHGLGEAIYGAGRGFASCLTIGLGTGIGGAFTEGDRVQRGVVGLAGHFGHMTVPEAVAEKLVCSCGHIGHIEPLASGSGLIARYQKATGEKLSGAEIAARAAAGDGVAAKIVFGSARALGVLIGDSVNLLDPGAVVLSGSVVNAGAGWWQAVREGYASSVIPVALQTPIVRGELQENAPLIGAAVHYRREHAK